MRILLVHHEAEYFAGAEKMLGYYLEGLAIKGEDVTVAAVAESPVADLIPARFNRCWLPPNAKFSPRMFWRQAQTIRKCSAAAPFEVIHGWAARDWELTAFVSRLTRCPAVGTLHDHPLAPFISRHRQKLMQWAARFGLRKVVCVSEAVRQACLEAGYPNSRLATVHNGLPGLGQTRLPRAIGPCRLGFLGVISERKGLRGIFEMLDQLPEKISAAWEMSIAGDAQEAAGRQLIEEIKSRFGSRPWWGQVRWLGWIKQPQEFLASLDLLVCPSSEFDPFPTVLLEAGQAGVPVLGARLGGVPEIIQEGVTGWLFDRQDWSQAARQLIKLLTAPDTLEAAGQAAKKRVEREFMIGRMVADYRRVYADLRA